MDPWTLNAGQILDVAHYWITQHVDEEQLLSLTDLLAPLPPDADDYVREDGAPMWWRGEDEASAASLRAAGVDVAAFMRRDAAGG